MAGREKAGLQFGDLLACREVCGLHLDAGQSTALFKAIGKVFASSDQGPKALWLFGRVAALAALLGSGGLFEI